MMKPEQVTTAPPVSAPSEGRGVESELVDVSALTLADLDGLGDTALAAALRRIILSDDDAPVCGFTSRI